MKKRMIALALSATMVLSAGVMLAGCSGDPDPNPDPNEKENVSLKRKCFARALGTFTAADDGGGNDRGV